MFSIIKRVCARITKTNLAPSRYIWYFNFCQCAAIFESISTNLRNRVANCHRCQSAAIIECIFSNRSDRVGDSHRCQFAVTRECRTSNRSDRVADCHRCQSAAILECITTNRSDRVTYRQFFYSMIAVKRRITATFRSVIRKVSSQIYTFQWCIIKQAFS